MKLNGFNLADLEYEKSPLEYTPESQAEIEYKLSLKRKKSKRRINMEKVGERLFKAPSHNENMGMDQW
jgi:hypothetical protein